MLSRPLLVLAFGLGNLLATVVGQDNPGMCPGDNGKFRTTSKGTYLITCNKRVGRGWMNPKEDVRDSFSACIDACAARTGCNGVDYNQDTKLCGYLSQATTPVIAASTGLGVHNARLAEKPSAPPAAPNPPAKDSDPVVPPATPSNDQAASPGNQNSTQQMPPGDGMNFPMNENTMSQNATCPTDDARVFLALDGSTFKLQCGKCSGGKKTRVGTFTVEPSYSACIEKCATNELCHSASYVARRATSSTNVNNSCYLFSESSQSDSTSQGEDCDFAYRVDPPTTDQMDNFPNQLCTTSCPFADGMSYASSYGESFKMDCGKRHGTTYLSIATAENFLGCMELCAAMVPCHSVDYHSGTKKCYLGSHHGNPLIIASSFDSAHSIGCSGACSSDKSRRQNIPQNIPQDTSQPISQPTPQNSSPAVEKRALAQPPAGEPDRSCGNEGLAYAFYPAIGALSTTSGSDFNPAAAKTLKPYLEGITSKIGTTAATEVYGQRPQAPETVFVNHKGYLYARDAGEYTFSGPASDDITLFWIGEKKAYSGWTRANADIEQPFVSGGATSTPKTYKMTLEKGKYYPIRIIWANCGGPGKFGFKITAPDGKVLLDDKTTNSPFLVRFSCDNIAKSFQPWGSET